MADTSSTYSYPQKRLSGTKVFFITILSVVIGLFVFLFLLVMGLASFGIMAAGTDKVSEPIVLEIDLRIPLLDSPTQPTLFADSPASVVGIVRSLDRAKDDQQVKGVFIRGESNGLAPASAEELRLALIDFRESGKFVITHAQGLASTSIIPFHAISASDEIWLQASTTLSTAGLYSQAEFFGGLIDKIEAQPQFIRHGAYKSAVNRYTETGYTPEQREATESLFTSIFDTTVDNIAQDRNLSRDDVLRLLSTAPHTARDAKDAGLIDKLGYLEEARDYVAEKAGDEDTVFKPIADYKPKGHFGKPVIAIVEGQGTILPGSGGSGNFLSPTTNIGGDSLAAALDSVIEDDDVKAVILRISSPGGSADASDQIMAAVRRVQNADKPVIVSMGKYAASGGYYIAAPADHIVALPQTITGSIGVYGGKIALEGAFAKVGYNLESIRIGGEYAGAYNGDEPFTEAQLAGYQRTMDNIYDTFVGLVAESRNMSREAVINVAEGRVWTGQQALERGLVDELGGFKAAVQAAKRFAELDEDADVQFKRFPREKSREELFNDVFSGSANAGRDLETLGALLDMPEVQAAMKFRDAMSTTSQELKANVPEF